MKNSSVDSSDKNETLSIKSKFPLLFSFILTILYGIIYLPDFFNLEQVLFQNSLSPFWSIFLVFSYRFVLSALIWLVFLPLVLFFRKKVTFRDFFHTLRLKPSQISWRNILVGLVTGLTFFGLVVFTAFLIGTFTPNFSLLNSPEYEGGVAWFIFVFALIPGIWEEVSFRGFILSSLRTKYSVRKAIVFNGLLFAVFHLYNYLLLGQDLVTVLLQSVAAIFVGMSLSYLVIKFNSILPAILIHYSIDVTLFIIDFNIDQGNETLTTIFYIIVLFILPSLLIILGSLVAKKMNVIEDIKTEVKIEQES